MKLCDTILGCEFPVYNFETLWYQKANKTMFLSGRQKMSWLSSHLFVYESLPKFFYWLSERRDGQARGSPRYATIQLFHRDCFTYLHVVLALYCGIILV